MLFPTSDLFQHSYFFSDTVTVDVPEFSPSGTDYTIDVFRYDSTRRQFDPFTPFRQITRVQRNEFPYNVTNLDGGVYSFRVDGQTATGVRTFSISRDSIPSGEAWVWGLVLDWLIDW